MRKFLGYIVYAILTVFCMVYGIYFIQTHGIKNYLVHELILHIDRVIPFVIAIFALIGIGIKKLYLHITKKDDGEK